ncbi:hypothetical protein I4F81_003166 [Pyropia yezoensis]|uniref:Uncharacterized protein n=1 Tax=Pyropia yezoensis TaxID=2788 RepID=A0ACC3BSK5_PYRYE|nr:hypothetical protein I4F81_003166 [Neopyropia yezoensis]
MRDWGCAFSGEGRLPANPSPLSALFYRDRVPRAGCGGGGRRRRVPPPVQVAASAFSPGRPRRPVGAAATAAAALAACRCRGISPVRRCRRLLTPPPLAPPSPLSSSVVAVAAAVAAATATAATLTATAIATATAATAASHRRRGRRLRSPQGPPPSTGWPLMHPPKRGAVTVDAAVPPLVVGVRIGCGDSCPTACSFPRAETGDLLVLRHVPGDSDSCFSGGSGTGVPAPPVDVVAVPWPPTGRRPRSLLPRRAKWRGFSARVGPSPSTSRSSPCRRTAQLPTRCRALCGSAARAPSSSAPPLGGGRGSAATFVFAAPTYRAPTLPVG